MPESDLLCLVCFQIERKAQGFSSTGIRFGRDWALLFDINTSV
jgi:hypothetical protein